MGLCYITLAYRWGTDSPDFSCTSPSPLAVWSAPCTTSAVAYVEVRLPVVTVDVTSHRYYDWPSVLIKDAFNYDAAAIAECQLHGRPWRPRQQFLRFSDCRIWYLLVCGFVLSTMLPEMLQTHTLADYWYLWLAYFTRFVILNFDCRCWQLRRNYVGWLIAFVKCSGLGKVFKMLPWYDWSKWFEIKLRLLFH